MRKVFLLFSNIEQTIANVVSRHFSVPIDQTTPPSILTHCVNTKHRQLFEITDIQWKQYWQSLSLAHQGAVFQSLVGWRSHGRLLSWCYVSGHCRPLCSFLREWLLSYTVTPPVGSAHKKTPRKNSTRETERHFLLYLQPLFFDRNHAAQTPSLLKKSTL